MKFQVNRDVFSEAVSFAVKLLPQRTTLPILSGVLIEATEGSLVLSSFDYEVSARTEIAAQVDEPGRVLVSGRLLADIASRYDGIYITSPGSRSPGHLLSPADFTRDYVPA